MKLLVFIQSLIVIGGIANCNQPSTLKIIPLVPYSHIDSFADGTDKYKYYMIINFSYNDKRDDSVIYSFAIKHLDQDYQHHNNFIIQFYRNIKNIDENPDDKIENHGDELVYNYFWENGRYAGFEYYKYGKLIDYKYILKDGRFKRPEDSKLKIDTIN